MRRQFGERIICRVQANCAFPVAQYVVEAAELAEKRITCFRVVDVNAIQKYREVVAIIAPFAKAEDKPAEIGYVLKNVPRSIQQATNIAGALVVGIGFFERDGRYIARICGNGGGVRIGDGQAQFLIGFYPAFCSRGKKPARVTTRV